MKKPEPVNQHIVCSVCGLDWQKHREYFTKHVRYQDPASVDSDVTLEVCVELLQAELDKRPKWRPGQFGVSGVAGLRQAS